MIVADTNPIIDLALKNGPLVALLLVILYGGFKSKPWWVYGWVYRELWERHERLRRQNEELRRVAIRGSEIAETLLDSKQGVENRETP